MNFSNALHSEISRGYTENGHVALTRTADPLVTLFGVIGSLRTRPADVISMFEDALEADALLALKMSFYARDIRGGLGERTVPRLIWTYLANEHPDVMLKNMQFIPEFGRWDDVYAFVGTPCEDGMWKMVSAQLASDIAAMGNDDGVTLLAKWLKSTNASSQETNKLGKLTAKNLGMTQTEYRKTLSSLRSYLKVTETIISSNKWEELQFGKIPSRAHMILRKAIGRHLPEQYAEYLESLEKGEEKINASTLYPYDILMNGGFRNLSSSFRHNATLQAMWDAQPNYVDEGDSVLIMADTSGSMTSQNGQPMATSVGLAIYFAERNTGEWKDKFMTFSSRPSFVHLKGNTLAEKIECVPNIVDNTDLILAFDEILRTAVEHKISQEDLPKAVVVISDMEIDDGCSRGWGRGTEHLLFHDKMLARFAEHDYTLPSLVYWNVASRQNVFHSNSDTKGVMLASGSSPSVFKAILSNIGVTPVEAMVNVLMSKRYEDITI